MIADEQFCKLRKVLFVTGIGRGINVKHLSRNFAGVSLVNIDFDASKRIAVIEFTDVEAAAKALKANHGTFLGGRARNCEFGSESFLKNRVGSTEITAEAVRYSPTQSIADEIVFSSEPYAPDQTTLSRRSSRKQSKTEKTKASQPMITDPAPSVRARPDKSVAKTSKLPIEGRAENTTVKSRGVEPYADFFDNEKFKDSPINQTVLDDLERDDDINANDPEPETHVYRELIMNTDLRKGPTADHIMPEIEQYATIPIPQIRAYYLPSSTQNKILSGLQASLEQVYFRYLQHKNPELQGNTNTLGHRQYSYGGTQQIHVPNQ
ncbi:hypothetical protein QM012_009360 [Aureobasidium pullulans]|uniref:RRM domain-containing protein n=1 Tax=Aureobasidium pullulans TaxID=5580 RepID=A0ABR0TGM8_AURPU